MALPNRQNGETIWAYMFNDIHAILNNLGNNTLTVTDDYTINTNEYNVFLVDASSNNVNVTLPDPTLVEGLKYTIKCVDYTNDVKIIGSIDEKTDYDISMKNESITIISNKVGFYEV